MWQDFGVWGLWIFNFACMLDGLSSLVYIIGVGYSTGFNVVVPSLWLFSCILSFSIVYVPFSSKTVILLFAWCNSCISSVFLNYCRKVRGK